MPDNVTSAKNNKFTQIKIAVFNNKGGVGKTTLSIILTQIALMHKKKVLAVDQDEQCNFSESIRYLRQEKMFKDLFTLETVLKQEDFQRPYDFMIIDCAPGFNERTRFAVRNADIVLIPVMPNVYSLMHFHKIVHTAGDKHLRHFPLVKIGFSEGSIHDESMAAKILSKYISEQKYRVIGDLPLYDTITANISSGRKK